MKSHVKRPGVVIYRDSASLRCDATTDLPLHPDIRIDKFSQGPDQGRVAFQETYSFDEACKLAQFFDSFEGRLKQ